ncbi:MAG: hypothetical protein ACW97Z_15795 [Candidatus Hodarchaeales archaeon]|jgi:hypothetical protein
MRRSLIFYQNERNILPENKTKILIGVYLVLTCYLLRIFSEIIHEILGHGLPTVLFGGSIEAVHISLISPFDTSHITLNQNNLSYEQYLLAVSGGMVFDLTLSFLLQSILLLKRLEWKITISMVWLAYWCYSNDTGIIIGNALMGGEGDMTEIIEAGIISAPFALILGITLYFLGFFLISTIIRRMLIYYSIEKQKVKFYILIFWMIVPFNVVLYILKTGFISTIMIGIIPLITSYLLEFQVLPRLDEENKIGI